jgi:hypothetical protein
VLSLHRRRRTSAATHGGAAPVYRITNAPVALEKDQSQRVRNYVVSMTLRIVFIVLAVFTQGGLRWAFALAAIFIPYFAVVIANGGRERIERATTLGHETGTELPAPPVAPAAPPRD